MALITSHIRFALDVAHFYPIQNLTEYISGTVYPDTRWMTGINRDLTHHERFMEPTFPDSDFTLGWHVHCVYDELQKMEHEGYFKNLDQLEKMDRWIQLSVAKVIQDMNDLQQFELVKMLEHLNLVKNPNGENIEKAKAFYRIIQNTYQHGKVPSPEQYYTLWTSVGLDAETTFRIIDLLKDNLTDQLLVKKIEDSHEKIVDVFKQQYHSS